MNILVRDLLRRKEPLCGEFGLDDLMWGDDALIDLMLRNPADMPAGSANRSKIRPEAPSRPVTARGAIRPFTRKPWPSRKRGDAQSGSALP
ncbi:thioredoxin domain-containing protein [Roseicella aquatilis]|uniref:Uncharacterized protein n=1 Tax=Roseicella aquatilis TaxID=2527868 RepID=A0A4R4DKV1_9PROT|nr:hypothetical protein [Roseicella aquatilis]TCZ61112.1 hypothetical protein EXY23_13360 [Roseicella aquatilis]